MPPHWLQSFTIWPQSMFPTSLPGNPSSLSPPPLLLTHTDLNACRLLHTISCLFLPLHLIRLLCSQSGPSSDTSSSVEPPSTPSGPNSCSLLCAPTRPCPPLRREHSLFPWVITPVNLEHGKPTFFREQPASSWNALRTYAINPTPQWIFSSLNGVWSWRSL